MRGTALRQTAPSAASFALSAPSAYSIPTATAPCVSAGAGTFATAAMTKGVADGAADGPAAAAAASSRGGKGAGARPSHHELPSMFGPRFTNPWPTWDGDKKFGDLMKFMGEMRQVRRVQSGTLKLHCIALHCSAHCTTRLSFSADKALPKGLRLLGVTAKMSPCVLWLGPVHNHQCHNGCSSFLRTLLTVRFHCAPTAAAQGWLAAGQPEAEAVRLCGRLPTQRARLCSAGGAAGRCSAGGVGGARVHAG